jgi:hypothetical protein
MVPILKSYDKFLTTKSISFIVNPIEVTKWEDQHGHLQVQAHEILVRFQEARSICTSEITEGATEIKRSTLFVMFTWDYNSIYTWTPNWPKKNKPVQLLQWIGAFFRVSTEGPGIDSCSTWWWSRIGFIKYETIAPPLSFGIISWMF